MEYGKEKKWNRKRLNAKGAPLSTAPEGLTTMAKSKRYPPEGFAERLRDLWLLSGLSQIEVARRTGYERKSIAAWINGDYVPSILALARLCRVFNVSADYLLFGKEKA